MVQRQRLEKLLLILLESASSLLESVDFWGHFGSKVFKHLPLLVGILVFLHGNVSDHGCELVRV